MFHKITEVYPSTESLKLRVKEGEGDARSERCISCIQANVILDKEASLNKKELTSINLTMLSGGLDTMTTLVQWSVALLAQRPDTQTKAIEAIREFYTDEEPLCNPLDDQKCAHIAAMVREFLRYYCVLRLAFPRATVKDVNYEGKLIPAGSTIYLNALPFILMNLVQIPKYGLILRYFDQSGGWSSPMRHSLLMA